MARNLALLRTLLHLFLFLAAFMTPGISNLRAQQRGEMALAPPMGWNSWDSYGLTITEAQFRANVDVMRTKLKPFGWRYAVIDEGWFFANPEARPHPEQLRYQLDGFGRYVPVPERFPSAAASKPEETHTDGQTTIDAANLGFAALGRWVHSQGLLFGIHIVRGIPRESVRLNLPVEGAPFHAQDVADTSETCPWDPTNWGVRDNAAGQAWYNAVVKQYAGWGVDLLKVDCISDHPYRVSEIRQLRHAIDASGRPMVLSLSPGPTSLDHAAEVGKLAQMWRISDDIWDIWESGKKFPQGVKSQFARLAAWASYAKPGNWPDADMLPIGQLAPKPDVGPGARRSRLTSDEQKTQITLWAIARSPLILGANLTLLDADTLRLITNKDVIRIDQTATASRQTVQEGDLIAWTADLPNGEQALAIFNVGDGPLDVDRSIAESGVGNKRVMREVWSGTNLKSATRIPAHGCALYVTAQ